MLILCGLCATAQPFADRNLPHPLHHTQRLPGVNEHRLARLEKMREQNLALRHRQGPWRANTQPQTKKGLVLLVEFSNTDGKMKSGAATQWNNRFNQQGYSLDSHIGSVRDYFIEQSYGLLTIDFDIVGPLTLSKEHDYYGTPPNSELDDRAAEMVIEALRLADSQVNYADYDWDGDGTVEQVYVIFAGITSYDEAGYIWPHEWMLSSAKYYGCGTGRQRLDNVYLDTYAVSNELSTSTMLEGIGTACHEFSHCLGYPDFYDSDYSGGTAAQNWDVLDGGCYNGPRGIGEIPSPYTAYERWVAGWIDLIPLTAPAKVTDMPAINEEGIAYVINNTGNSNEYYILENRQQKTFGRYNRGHGLMVWHIDYNRQAWNYNTVNADVDHQRMTFLPADGKVGTLRQDTYGYYYTVTADDEAGDPYPGKKDVKSVQPLTWFVSERGGTQTHPNLIHDISETSKGLISFIYGDYKALPAPEIAEPTNILEDSFTANWLPVEGATTTFRAEDFDRLYDSPFLLGNYYSCDFTHEGHPYHFAVETPDGIEESGFREDFCKIVSAATRLMGEVPYDNYCLIHMGAGGGGLEHWNSQACYTDGSYRFTSRAHYITFMAFTAHEYFHLYNVKCIRPAELWPYNYDTEAVTPLLWVSEGLTCYYEFRLLTASGVATIDEALQKLSGYFSLYAPYEGQHHMSLRQSSYDIWLNFMNRDANDRDVRVNYYFKGPVVGLLMDIEIRRHTGREKSLDDVMRALYNRYYKQLQRGFTEEEFWQEVEAVYGGPVPQLRALVNSTDDIDYEAYLRDAGLYVDTEHWAIRRAEDPTPDQTDFLQTITRF